MSDVSNHTPTPEQLNYLWDQYKYRHGLCWKAVYKIVAVVIVLAVLPHAKKELTASTSLGNWMLVPPIIGALLAAFGVFVVNNELRLFSQVKVAHNALQKRFFERFLERDAFAVENLTLSNARWTSFDIYVHLLMIILFLLSLGNTLVLACLKIPGYFD
jgi:hypothetical protein